MNRWLGNGNDNSNIPGAVEIRGCEAIVVHYETTNGHTCSARCMLALLTQDQALSTYSQPILMTATTSIFVLTLICKFHTMRLGIGMITMSMNMLRAQLERTKVRESIHVPPLIMTLPSASYRSIAGRSQVYCTGLHCNVFPKVVATVYPTFNQTEILGQHQRLAR